MPNTVALPLKSWVYAAVVLATLELQVGLHLLQAAASSAALVAGRAAGDGALGANCSPHEASKEAWGFLFLGS